MLATLVKLRIRLWLNRFRARSFAARTSRVVLGISVPALGFMIFHGLLNEFTRNDVTVVEPLIGTALVVMIVFPLLRGFGVVLQHLFFASDLQLLLTTPISFRSLYVFKQLEVLRSVSLSGSVLLLALVALGIALHAGAAFYVVTVLVIGLLLFLVTSFCFVLLLLITHIVPPRRIRNMLVVISGLVGVSVYGLTRLLPHTSGLSPAQIRGLKTFATRSATWWAPTTWATHAIDASARHAWGAVATNTSLLLATSAAFTAAGFMLFRKTFLIGWSRVAEIAPRSTRPRSARIRDEAATSPVPRWLRAVVTKEWLALKRDPRALTVAIFPVVFTGFLLFKTVSNASQSSVWPALFPLLFFPFMISSNLSPHVVVREGKNLELLRTTPIALSFVLAGKLVAIALPISTLAIAASVTMIVVRHAPIATIGIAIPLAVWICTGLVAINVGLAAVSADFDSNDPKVSPSFTGAFGGLIACAVFVLCSVTPVWWAIRAPSALPEVLLIVPVAVAATIPSWLFWMGARRLESLAS